jgi:hypothetical protein
MTKVSGAIKRVITKTDRASAVAKTSKQALHFATPRATSTYQVFLVNPGRFTCTSRFKQPTKRFKQPTKRFKQPPTHQV